MTSARFWIGVGVAVSLAISVLAAFFVGHDAGWKAREAIVVADALKASEGARSQEHKAVAITDAVATRHEEAAVQIRTVYRDILKEVPTYVTAQADAACVVPAGFVRFHDDAAAGRVPDPAGLADEAPSGVALSGVASTAAENYGTYAEVARQLTDLQDWVETQKASADAKR